MKVTFVERGRTQFLQIDNARIIFRNFEGRGDKFNREGDRNFALLIDDLDIYEELKAAGWNVKSREPRDEGDMPFMFLPVKVIMKHEHEDGYERNPVIWLLSGENRVKLDAENVGLIDNIDIANVDLDIRAYDWEMNGRYGRSAYLQSMAVTQEFDRFAARYEE